MTKSGVIYSDEVVVTKFDFSIFINIGSTNNGEGPQSLGLGYRIRTNMNTNNNISLGIKSKYSNRIKKFSKKLKMHFKIKKLEGELRREKNKYNTKVSADQELLSLFADELMKERNYKNILMDELSIYRKMCFNNNITDVENGYCNISILGIKRRFKIDCENTINSDDICSFCLYNSDSYLNMCYTCNALLCQSCYLKLATTGNGSVLNNCFICKKNSCLKRLNN